MKKVFSRLVCFVVCVALFSGTKPVFAQVTIVKQGQSSFTIVVPATAPGSVQNAAAELQKCVQLATGVQLPLQKDDAALTTAFVSLGNTPQAQAAGLDVTKMPDEAHRIVTRNGNLYILGPDTPAGGWTKNDGVSNGTAHGVYTFLEEYLDVRWLMPGDLGRDVPRRTGLNLPAIDRTHVPAFDWRRVTHLWDHSDDAQMRSIVQWMDRQKLGGATNLDYDHNMWRAVIDSASNFQVDTPAVKELYDAHPEWFAMNAEGKRPYPRSHYDKLETTNPELVRWFADRAIKNLKNSPRPRTYSLSPSDGRGWSQSPESKALYDPNPSNLFNPEASSDGFAKTSLVLKWYSDIAQIVAQEHPEGRLTGYIYGDYLYPPTKVAMKLPDNFMPVIVPSFDFGYRLYRKDTQHQFNYVMDAWGKVAPRRWYYYDLPAQFLRQHDDEIGGGNFPGSTGLISPPAPGILNTIFSSLDKNRIKGAMIYGVPSWSNAALGNYLLAKLQWNPKLNAYDVQREWLHRAYGPQAGAAMEKFYEQLEKWVAARYETHQDEHSLLTVEQLKGIYATNYPAMEALYLEAKKQPMTEVQRERLNLIEENLIVLQWRLRNAGFLPAQWASPLQRSDAQINALLTADSPAFSPFPGAEGDPYVNWQPPTPLPWKVQLGAANAAPPLKSTVPNGLDDSQFLLHAARGGELRITAQSVKHGAYFASFQLKDQQGILLASGILNTATPIVVPAKAGGSYVLTIPSRKAVNYQLRVENAAVATADFADGTLSLFGRPAATYILHLPQSEPVGIFEDGEGVVLKKPFSGAAAQAIMGDAYVNTRVLHAFDEGWKFSPDPQNDGEARGVLKADFDDSKWAGISPLDWWQMQGYPDYHGVAWYRIKFNAEALPKTDRARLYFGAIDGHATIYVNGHKLIERQLPSDFKGWDLPFSNQVNDYMKAGENILVVKVTSKTNDTASGIFKGAAIVAGTRKE